MESTQLYKPPGSQTLDQITIQPQVRLMLQGMPGSGKTWSSLTFPDPIVINLDRGLGAHTGRTDVTEVPFYNPSFVDSIYPRTHKTAPPNKRDALLKWLGTEAHKLSAQQTLVLDGSTGIQNAFETEYALAPVMSKGVPDNFAPWRLKIEYFGEIMELLKSLQCHVVYIIHETPDRDSKGELNGLVRPLMSGQFADQLASHFTDSFRCVVHTPPTKETEQKAMEFYGITQTVLQDWYKRMPKQAWYMWQSISDEKAFCKTSTLIGAPKFIPAVYDMFSVYRRKV